MRIIDDTNESQQFIKAILVNESLSHTDSETIRGIINHCYENVIPNSSMNTYGTCIEFLRLLKIGHTDDLI